MSELIKKMLRERLEEQLERSWPNIDQKALQELVDECRNAGIKVDQMLKSAGITTKTYRYVENFKKVLAGGCERPTLNQNPDLTQVKALCENYCDFIESNRYNDDESNDFLGYIAEAIIQAMYGKDFWAYKNYKSGLARKDN